MWILLLLAFVPASAFAEVSSDAMNRLDMPLSSADQAWVSTTLQAMSLEQKAAQMVMVRAAGRYQHPRSTVHRELLAQVRELGVGGLVVFDAETESLPRLLNDLQDAAGVPLLVAADVERGVAFRARRGTVSLPYAMALGATRSTAAARFVGEVTARESRALGIHWAFAPVTDVNSNPANPIINIRSFGEDPQLVADLGAAFIDGAREGGLLTTAKHFPGHGDTATDSHYALPTIHANRQRLEAIELLPFRHAIAAGVDAVMLGHIAVPSLDPSRAPATLSPAMTTTLLRDELGFAGLVVTDAMEMGGIRQFWTGAAALRAVLAGADVVLMPRQPQVAVKFLAQAVREGQLGEERLDASVRRLLETKARLGLHRHRLVDPETLRRDVDRPEDQARSLEVAQSSITLIRNDGDLLPLGAEKPLRLLHLVLSSRGRDRAGVGLLEDELEARRVDTRTYDLGPEISPETADEIVASAADATEVVVSVFMNFTSVTMPPAQVRLLRRLHEAGARQILVSYGSPYLLAQVPWTSSFLCAYGSAEVSQRAAMAALFGEFDLSGRLPVSLPGLYPYGHGIDQPRRDMMLHREAPEEAGLRGEGLAEVDSILADFVAQGAFPGGVLAVGYRGALVHLQPFGRLTYDRNAPAVSTDTIYDLASLTKVVVTTTLAMILVDEGLLELDRPVEEFLPRFVGSGKEAVTVRHLLSHASGLDWWAPLYQELAGKEAYVERIQVMDLVYEPGSRSLYSDLGLILLGEILERVAGEPLDQAARRLIFAPLSMEDTLFRPPASLHKRIAPTEDDPWRGRVLRGEVHDENAFALGGVAPHAGLFSTAGDLARFAQMILNGGVYAHHRLLSRRTVELFTRPSGVFDSTRALGWDTKSPQGSSAGELFSPLSFGHTGFTGTSLWIDPDRELFVILLTNRVHPTRDNNLIRKVRPAVADAVVRALAEL